MSGVRSRYLIARLDFGMRTRSVALIFAMSSLVGVVPAEAQFFGFPSFRHNQPPPQLTSQEMLQRLARAGYRVSQLRMNGNVFLADVTDRSGQPLRLVISSTDAQILQRFAAVAPRVGGPDGGYSAPQPGFAPSAPGAFHLITPKLFYVSPYSALDLHFDFKLKIPGEQLDIHIDDRSGPAGPQVLLSALTGRRCPLTTSRLLWLTLKFPLITLKVIFLIHWQAFRLWLRKLPFHRKSANPQLQQDVYHPHRPA